MVDQSEIGNSSEEAGKVEAVIEEATVKEESQGQGASKEEPLKESSKEESSSGTDWKAEARKWEARAKSNYAELRQLRETGGESQSAIDELRQRNSELEERFNALTVENLRRKIASEYGLDDEAIGFLQGGDEDSIGESAKALKALIDRGEHGVRRLAGCTPVNDAKHQENISFADALVTNSRR